MVHTCENYAILNLYGISSNILNYQMWGFGMAVSYKPLFKLMIDRNIRKGDIVRMSGVAYSTLGKMANGENVNMSVVEKVCLALNCKIEDVVEILPEQSEK